MCIVIDNDSFGLFLKKEKEVKPIYDWLNRRNNKLAFSNHARFEDEYSPTYRSKLQEYRRAGKLKLVDKAEVQQKLTEVKKQQPKSNDDHIVALCLAARVKVVFTRDHALHDDIKRIVKGSIYQNEKHKRLLIPDICP